MALAFRSLWAKTGTISLPGSAGTVQVPFWGFSGSEQDSPIFPGPILEVREGDIITVTLRSEIPFPTSLVFPGQRGVLVRRAAGVWKRVSPEYAGGIMTSFTDSLSAEEAWVRYLFRAARPGVFLYESGTRPDYQVQMGLYGVIIVRPRGFAVPGNPGYRTAYGPCTASRFDVEKVLVLGEVHKAMHESLARGLGFNMMEFAPDAWVINGRSYPDTVKPDGDPSLPSQPHGSEVQVGVGQRVLLRLVNAGFLNHTVHLGGLTGTVIAEDAFPLVSGTKDASYEKTAITLGAGQRVDVLIVPEHPGEYLIRSRDYSRVVNDDSFPGGMMTRLVVSP